MNNQIKIDDSIIESTEKNQRRQQEQELIHTEHLRRLEIIEGLSIDYESIFYVDLNRNLMKAYRVGVRFKKQFPEALMVCDFAGFDADYIRDWVHPEDRNILAGVTNVDYIRKKLSTDRSFFLNYRAKKGDRITYMQLRIVTVGKEEPVSQVVLGYRNVDKEMTQKLQREQMLVNALNEAKAANNARNLFLANMSHDIRTPMNAIVSFTMLAKKHLDEKEKVLGYLDTISDSSSQLIQLLNDVLEISRIESGKTLTEEVVCSLTDVTSQVYKDMLSMAQRKHITISLNLSEVKYDMVCMDRQKFVRIMSYLLDNAIKYTNEKGKVGIIVREEEETNEEQTFYQFVVEDNGIGISEEFIQHIYEPFEREKNTTLSGVYGTGLGLTITKNFVEMMGGTIQVSSSVGKGSRFTVRLPLKIQRWEAVESSDNGEVSIAGISGQKRILIVDDNEINREIEREVLEDVGFLVDTAVDGKEAVEKIRKAKPGEYALILMDIQMPVMNGYRATKAIRELEDAHLASIPIIAVSANTFEEDKKMAAKSGMNAHIGKPLDMPELYRMIGKFLQDDGQE